ncbi:MAG TPA: hypothetical protein VFB43_16335 [Terracidiphilus sp.]|nr:hypothetical protein [Terracidiphilus sp.]
MSEDQFRIAETMTIREASSLWHDPRSEHLQHWAETFGVCLKDFHAGHIRTYQLERSQQVAGAQVDAEVDALLALLTELGLGQEIRLYYRSFADEGEITPAEFGTLPEAARLYIDKLKQKISELEAMNHRMENRIRKTNWGRGRG